MILKLEDGREIQITPEAALALVAALWDIAATTSGAVAIVGKLQHQLALGRELGIVELVETERSTVQLALGEPPYLEPGFAQLRDAIR